MKQLTIVLATVIVTALVCLGAFYAWSSSSDSDVKSGESDAVNQIESASPAGVPTSAEKERIKAQNRLEIEKLLKNQQ